MEEKGLESLMKKLGVKNFKELHEYIHSEEHKNEKVVKEFKEFLEYLKLKDRRRFYGD